MNILYCSLPTPTELGDWILETSTLIARETNDSTVDIWGTTFSDKPIYIYYIYIYGPIHSRPRSLHPPNGLCPQVALPSLLFASYWHHF